MKRNALWLGVMGVLLLAVAGWNLLADPQEQRQQISLDNGFKVGSVLLKAGDYVVIHQSEKDRVGEECTFFYRVPYYRGKPEAAKVRCQLAQGRPVQEFTMESTKLPDGTRQINSIQFAGSSEIHHLETGS